MKTAPESDFNGGVGWENATIMDVATADNMDRQVKSGNEESTSTPVTSVPAVVRCGIIHLSDDTIDEMSAKRASTNAAPVDVTTIESGLSEASMLMWVQ